MTLPYSSDTSKSGPYAGPVAAAQGPKPVDPYGPKLSGSSPYAATSSGAPFAAPGRWRDPAERRGGPLRVVHVGPCLSRGGAEVWLIDFLRFVDPCRLRVTKTIATEPDRVDPAFVADLTVPVETGDAAAVRRAAADCDVLLAWGIALDDILIGHRPPLCVFVAHGDGPWTASLMDRSRRVVDHAVAVSERVRDEACTGVPTTVIYNGIDTARLARTAHRDTVRASLGFGPEDFVVGYVGRFSGEKRVGAIIDAVAGMPPRFKALLVGWGADYPALLDQAGRRLPGRHAFASGSRDLGDVYGAMDAFCLVGREEGFSLAMIEAMQCGVPIVATPVGAVPEVIVDRVNGTIVDGSPASIRAGVARLAQFPRWARGAADEAHHYADRHLHAARMVRDYEHLIDRLWDARPSHSSANGHAHAGMAPAMA